jgi:hypothetical protein
LILKSLALLCTYFIHAHVSLKSVLWWETNPVKTYTGALYRETMSCNISFSSSLPRARYKIWQLNSSGRFNLKWRASQRFQILSQQGSLQAIETEPSLASTWWVTLGWDDHY